MWTSCHWINITCQIWNLACSYKYSKWQRSHLNLYWGFHIFGPQFGLFLDMFSQLKISLGYLQLYSRKHNCIKYTIMYWNVAFCAEYQAISASWREQCISCKMPSFTKYSLIPTGDEQMSRLESKWWIKTYLNKLCTEFTFSMLKCR
jgi:hypothetical protein